ncbi:MAG: hypothetical protein VXY53_08220, partial [Candidatus Thermoplasmatota archaeon]|nr:hypothetical protein [Candidatus Thermoplasmatota archaeon]
MSQLGRSEISDKVASCTLSAGSEERFTGSIVLISSNGDAVELVKNQFSVAKGNTQVIDINTTNWLPDAGEFTLNLAIIDSYGRDITTKSIEVVSRSSGWNIGINELSANGDISFSISRTSYERLQGITCIITFDSPDNSWSQSMIIDIAGEKYARTYEISDPGVLSNDDLIRADLSC